MVHYSSNVNLHYEKCTPVEKSGYELSLLNLYQFINPNLSNNKSNSQSKYFSYKCHS